MKPDGSSRKPDHDKVNQFLNLVMEPLLDEAAARFDPTVDDSQIDGTTIDETGMLQILVGWREQAWRNAERLVNAPTPAARALVEAQIERTAAIEANLIVVATSYSAVNVQAALSLLVQPRRPTGRHAPGPARPHREPAPRRSRHACSRTPESSATATAPPTAERQTPAGQPGRRALPR